MAQTPKMIGYLGLGNMGLPMANNLQAYIEANHLPPLVVWNRSKDKYAKLLAAQGVHQPEDVVVTGCDVIFTSFANDQAANEVYEKLFVASAGKGPIIFVDQSTLDPKTSALLADKAKQVGCTYLASPVFGQPPAVIAKTMVCTVAGDAQAIEVVKPILETLGRATILIGPDVAHGAKVKLLAKMMLYESIQVFSEVYALAEVAGFPADKLHEVFQTIIPAPPLLNYSNRISKGDFDGSTGFKLDGGIKDVKHMLALRSDAAHAVPLPVLEKLLANLESVKSSAGDQAKDLSVESLSNAVRDEAGLPARRHI